MLCHLEVHDDVGQVPDLRVGGTAHQGYHGLVMFLKLWVQHIFLLANSCVFSFEIAFIIVNS